MNEVQRHNGILSLLDDKHAIKVSTIIDTFNVSPATARRDLSKLDDLGKLRKVRNGAERIEKLKKVWSPLGPDNTEHYGEKTRIAAAAAGLCDRGDSVVINCGSTAFMLGQELCGEDIKIITNYFPLASYLIEQDHDCVIITGGQYNKSKNIFLNPTPELTGTYAGNWMFTSGKGFTEQGLYKTDMLTAVAEQQMLEQVGKLVVVVDSSKIGQRSGMLFCTTSKIDILITGKDADQTVIAALREKGIEVILV
ncbi:HTH-type transcriptional regulator UlaR [Vibrio sp. DW001]|uniref:HTH-type transcriptional regulator UlaR n=1 Tax=unclassified Vibrio TaxID=2614977 RepID=UPI00189DAF1D|nr:MULTISPECIES: HTH-type transcriptional regulator UlaR [unclassified Vibrio]UGA56969.1 HTH-type transcriptional regulator UlaR [Vibrio sp. VB16]WED29400.1 HTH-type transcriptional regulator UlaR [Vibrio sp. DW001]